MPNETRIGFIGGGNMAEAIIKGLLSGGVPIASLAVAEPSQARAALLTERYGIRICTDNAALCQASDTVILAVKPQMCGAALKGISDAFPDAKLVISVMAGIKSSAVEAMLGSGTRVVRVMPNTPALVLAGASALARGAFATDEDLALTRKIFDLVGTTCLVEEKLLDAVTGLSGSGPAYVLTFIEAMSDAGVKHGLSREVATALAAQTVYGTAKLLLETHEHPAVLRGNVTSPGGTTIAGMHSLERDGFRAATMNAVEAGVLKSKELGEK
jgi:pyrroline-5-carboxylate reductase